MRSSIGRFVAILALAMLIVAALAGAARAATVYSLTGGEFKGEPDLRGSMAVDDVTGDIIGAASEGFGPVPGLAIYSPEGPGAKLVATFTEPELGLVGPIAIDEANRSLYVGDKTNGRIEKFTITGGAGALTLTPDNSFTSPGIGAGPGQIASFGDPIGLDLITGMSVDPSTSDLLVADTFNRRVNRYGPDGSFISSFAISDPDTGTKAPTSLAVDATGEIYVVVRNLEHGGLQDQSSGVLKQYSAAGDAIPATLPDIPFPRYVTADQASGNIVVIGRTNGPEMTPPVSARVYSIHDSELFQEIELPESTTSSLVNSVVAGAHRLYLGFRPFQTSFSVGVVTLDAAIAPDVSIGSAKEVTSTGATLSWTINSLGQATTYHLEYTREGGAPTKTAETQIGEGSFPDPFAVTLEDLTPNSKYVARVVASNAQASIASSQTTFTTQKAPPAAVTGAGINPTETSAELSGTVNPFGQPTTYFFEYGESNAYGSRFPLNGDLTAGVGRDPLHVSQVVQGLRPGTAYHFRIVARNASGVTVGSDEMFTSAQPEGDRRAWELVTPDEKGNSNVYSFFLHAARSGNAITYEMQNPIPGLSKAFPKFPRYTSTRTATGWQTVGLDPISAPAVGTTVFGLTTLAVSEDGTKAVVLSAAALAPGAKSGGSNLYLYDPAAGTYETIMGSSNPAGYNDWASVHPGGSKVVIGGTSDFSRIYLENGSLVEHSTPFEMVPGVTTPSLYEWSKAGGLKVVAENVSVIGVLAGVSSEYGREQRAVSDDAEVAFHLSEADFAIHAYDRGEDVQVSEGFAEFVAASADGRYAFYLENETLYRFDLTSHERLTIANQVSAAFGVSRDGATVYFNESGGSLFVWRGGETNFVMDSQVMGIGALKAASPDGRYAAFSVGPHDEELGQIYRYDADTHQLSCASCMGNGAEQPLSPSAGEEEHIFEFYQPRVVLNDGEVFFDSPDRLVPEDVNSVQDVYSYDGKRQRLISAGTGNSPSYFGDASESGNDVFFVTGRRLVGADTNDDVDLYDARRGGGIASQNPESAQQDCASAGCRGESGASPAPQTIGSESNRAAPPSARPNHRHKKKTCPRGKAKGKKHRNAKCVKRHAQKKASHNRGHAR